MEKLIKYHNNQYIVDETGTIENGPEEQIGKKIYALEDEELAKRLLNDKIISAVGIKDDDGFIHHFRLR